MPQDVFTPGSQRAADETFDGLPQNVQASNNPNVTTPANIAATTVEVENQPVVGQGLPATVNP